MDTSPQLAHILRAMADSDPNKLPTPAGCTADFCLIPLGTPTASVSQEVAHVQRFLAKTGLHYSMHAAGTTLEGSWQQVTTVIGQCHTMLHARGVVRIQSDIRIGSRTDKKQSYQDKVDAVEKLLAADNVAGGEGQQKKSAKGVGEEDDEVEDGDDDDDDAGGRFSELVGKAEKKTKKSETEGTKV